MRKDKTQAPADHARENDAELPQTFEHAVLHGAWRLPPWLRYILVLFALVVGALFAVWVSRPDSKKEQAIDALTGGQRSRTEVLARSTDQLPQHTGIRSTAVPLTVVEMRNRVVELHTTNGVIRIELLPDVAPNHVRNFISLAESGLYNGTRFHRVIPGFVIVGGDPNTTSDDRARWGLGGAIGTLRAEFSDIPHDRGVVSMARNVNPNSGSSQFFICLARLPILDRKYTVFGRVVSGMDVVDQIASAARDQNDQPYDPVMISSVTVRIR